MQDTGHLMRRDIPECAPLAILEDILGQIKGTGNRHHLLNLCTCKHDAQHAGNHTLVGSRAAPPRCGVEFGNLCSARPRSACCLDQRSNCSVQGVMQGSARQGGLSACTFREQAAICSQVCCRGGCSLWRAQQHRAPKEEQQRGAHSQRAAACQSREPSQAAACCP